MQIQLNIAFVFFIGTLNAFLTSPLLAGLGSNSKSKVLKLQGYKARLTKEDETNSAAPSYGLEML